MLVVPVSPLLVTNPATWCPVAALATGVDTWPKSGQSNNCPSDSDCLWDGHVTLLALVGMPASCLSRLAVLVWCELGAAHGHFPLVWAAHHCWDKRGQHSERSRGERESAPMTHWSRGFNTASDPPLFRSCEP